MEEILNLYKPVGLTPLQLLECCRERFPEYRNAPMTYAGRLDPIAEGVLLVLAGKTASDRDKYLGLDKEYEAEILFGLGTDTGDVLGRAGEFKMHSSAFKVREDEIREILKFLTGKVVLPLPVYSSVPVRGQPLFEWARSGRLAEIEIPEREMEIFSVELQSLFTMSADQILLSISQRVSRVRGDFRQGEIHERWKVILSGNQKFSIAKVSIRCASGTYIRSFANQLGKSLGVPSLLFCLIRTKVGAFGIHDSIRVL